MEIEFAQINQEKIKRLYPLGFEFDLKRGKKDKKTYKILDYIIKHNSKGQIIDFKYLCASYFLGQEIKEEFVATTIDIATNNGWKLLK